MQGREIPLKEFSRRTKRYKRGTSSKLYDVESDKGHKFNGWQLIFFRRKGFP